MSDQFFNDPILNSPYRYPDRHWELDDTGQPTEQILENRREARFITPIPKPKKKKKSSQVEFVFDEAVEISDGKQQYEQTAQTINALRIEVNKWRNLPSPNDWKVTPETARLLQHWRNATSQIRPFFCQVEAVETVIWLTEVAPQSGKSGKLFLEHLFDANQDANPELMRLALKLATGAGKTTVMSMLIAWQTINAVRRPASKKFTRGFLIVAPGLTIKDRLRVLQPNDPDSYYTDPARQMVPQDMLADLDRAKIVVTNYHAFKLREKISLSKGNRSLLQGRGEDLNTMETEGQMIQRVMPDLMGMKRIMVINDEAHHCYREKPGGLEDLKGDEKKEAQQNTEAARLWITGLEIVKKKIGITNVIDLSATPFFLSGSGYAEGTLFPWTMSDFSLMDAIECGIVKLPRVPVADNIPGNEMPMYRELWKHIGKKLPKKARGQGDKLDPAALPPQLLNALDALYGHYDKTYQLWQEAGIDVPPCFIVVCNNTSTSKLVYDYISGYEIKHDNESTELMNGRLPLFRNYDEYGNPYPRPNTLLIDSMQLESGEALDKNFRTMAGDEIERFRREILERTGDKAQADNITDQDLLREVMNTVGKKGRLGQDIRCVISVSMLTEGWDANNVTHVLGVRAFGTQLLCEQVIGRALRRQSYIADHNDCFGVEYADVLGIPFDFNAKPVVSAPTPPPETTRVKAMEEREEYEITFPRVTGFRVEYKEKRLEAEFISDSTFKLTPDHVGATQTENSGIIGESADLTVEHLKEARPSTILYHITQHLMNTRWKDDSGMPQLHLFGQLKRITRFWLENHLICEGDTFPAQMLYRDLTELACDRIHDAINRAAIHKNDKKTSIIALLDPYAPTGTTSNVNFNTSKKERWDSFKGQRCHVNWVVLDSDWEAEFCRVAEKNGKVLAYVKNHNLGFEIPYTHASVPRIYIPDFIVLIDDGHGPENPLHLIVEIKGVRPEEVKDKQSAVETYWLPGVNQLEEYGRWAFAEFSNIWGMESQLSDKIEQAFNTMIDEQVKQ